MHTELRNIVINTKINHRIMARQRFILQFANHPQSYMGGTTPGGRAWIMTGEDQAKQFTYLQAVKYTQKYPGRFNIEPSLYGIA